MKSLYDLTGDGVRLAEALEQAEGDFSKVEGLEAFFDQTAADTAEKLDAYLAVIHQLEMEGVRAKQERDQWEARRAARENRIEFLKARLKEHLERTGQAKVVTATGRIVSLATNGGNPPVKYGEGEKPSDWPGYFVVSEKWDTAAVLAALNTGELPFAKFGPRGTSLRVR